MDHRNKNSKRYWNNKLFGEKKDRNQISEEEQKTIVDEIEPLCNNFTFAKRGDLKKMFYFSVTIPQKNKEYVTKHDSSYDHSLLNNNRGAIRAIE